MLTRSYLNAHLRSCTFVATPSLAACIPTCIPSAARSNLTTLSVIHMCNSHAHADPPIPALVRMPLPLGRPVPAHPAGGNIPTGGKPQRSSTPPWGSLEFSAGRARASVFMSLVFLSFFEYRRLHLECFCCFQGCPGLLLLSFRFPAGLGRQNDFKIPRFG